MKGMVGCLGDMEMVLMKLHDKLFKKPLMLILIETGGCEDI